jgi:hypothetical protein
MYATFVAMEGNIAADRYEHGFQTGAGQSLTAEPDADADDDADASQAVNRSGDCDTKA